MFGEICHLTLCVDSWVHRPFGFLDPHKARFFSNVSDVVSAVTKKEKALERLKEQLDKLEVQATDKV